MTIDMDFTLQEQESFLLIHANRRLNIKHTKVPPRKLYVSTTGKRILKLQEMPQQFCCHFLHLARVN
jgi:hypothetical protein